MRLNFPVAKYDKFSAIEWKPRRWQGADPLKGTQANVIAANNQLAESKGVELDERSGSGALENRFQELDK